MTSSFRSASGARARTDRATLAIWVAASGRSPRCSSALPPSAATIRTSAAGRGEEGRLEDAAPAWAERHLDPLPLDRAGHAAGTAAAAAELAAGDGDDLDAVASQVGVAGDVALVREDHAR